MKIRFLCLATLVLAGCDNLGVQLSGKENGSGTLSHSVRVKWTQSTDHDVRGYRVYRGTAADFAIADAPFTDAGALAASALVPNVPSGPHFFKVVTLGNIPAMNGVGGGSVPVLVYVLVP